MKAFAQAAPGPPALSHFSCYVISQSCCFESEKSTERAAISSHKPCCTTAWGLKQPDRLMKKVRRRMYFTGH